MRVITCSDCGRPVSDTERACPYCGCPVNISLDKMLREKRKQAQQSGMRNISSYNKTASNSRFDLQMGAVNSGRKNSTAIKSRTVSSTVSTRRKRAKAAQKRRRIRLVLIAILVVLLAVLMILGISKCSSKPENLAQPVYDNNGYVYYANDRDDGKLYKARLSDDELTDKQKLSEYSPSELIMDDEWLYYTNNNRDNMIYRVNTHGLDESLVYADSAKNLEIIGGWLFFDNKNANYDQYVINLAHVKTGEVVEAVPSDGAFEGLVPESSQPDSQESSEAPPESQDNPESKPASQENQDSQSKADLSVFTPNIKVSNSKLPWNLVLTNKYNALSTNFDGEIETAALQNGKKVDKRIKTKLNDMIAAMEAEIKDCSIYVSSSYRTVATQQSLFERKIESLVASGMTPEEADIKAVETVSKAGTSDHNTGLAVDFNDGIASFSETKEYKWLQKNAYKYGFIERYPQSGEAITECTWEPYHYRYVGNEAAEIIHEEGITLEQYIFKYYNGCVVVEE